MYAAYQYHNLGHALKTIIRTEGVRALYRGSVASFIKIPASMGLAYGLYDGVNKLVGADGLRMCAPRLCHGPADYSLQRSVQELNQKA